MAAPLPRAPLPTLSRGGQAGARVAWSPPAASRWAAPPPARTGRRSAGLPVVAVIPMLGPNGRRAPPDLASFLLKERIVYLGMALVPSVTELLVAEMLYLQYDAPTKPIYLYINSAGVQKGGGKLGYEAEALAIYDTMCHVKPPVRTLCVGTAYGEAAILLAAGEKGTRAALPSASIQLRQPMQRFAQMQASDVDIYRTELRKTKAKLFGLLSKHTGKTPRALERDLARPKYLNPYDAVNYGVIDRVLAPGGGGGGKGGRAAEVASAAAAEEATREMVMRSSYSTGLFDEVDAEAAGVVD